MIYETQKHVTNLKCFPQVAKVIGHANAQRELFKVCNHAKAGDVGINVGLIISFNWRKTPQGRDFWTDINNGINPY